ncbi:MAG: hypothetical protein ACLTKT_04025 [Clostridia bacterium]|nr:hypothetical protein [Clostridium sp.]
MKKEKTTKKVQHQEEQNLATKDKSSKIFFIVAIILIAMFSLALTPVTLQNDTYYTIEIGKQIMETGIDMQDHFSWHQDLAYTYPHWLYDLITYQIYSSFGMTGIFVTTCILSMILGVSLFLINNKITKNQVVSFLISVGVMYLIKDYIAARAQLVTFILFIWMIYCIEMFLKGKKKRYAIGIVGISILIANLHVAVWPFLFVLFLPYIAEYIIASLADVIIYRKDEKRILELKIKHLKTKNIKHEKLEALEEKLIKLNEHIDRVKIKRAKELENPYKIKLVKNKNIKWLILIMIICLFTGLITPLGDTPYTYLAKTMQGNTTQNINEHLPMTIIEQPEVLSTIIIFLAILIFTKTKIRLNDLFMIGGLCFLMLMSRRQLSMFALVGSIILNRLICDMIKIYNKEPKNNDKKKGINKLAFLGMIIIMSIMSYHFAEEKSGDHYIDETTYPVQACDYILNNIDLGTAKFYNEYNYGSYMIYRGIPVFIDSRADLYAPEFSGKEEDIFMDFINVSSIGDFYEDIFEKYGITHAIMYKDAKISMIIDKTNDENYKKIYEDDYFVIYERLNA